MPGQRPARAALPGTAFPIPIPERMEDAGGRRGMRFPEGAAGICRGEIGFVPSWLFPQPGNKGDSGLSHPVPGFPNLWEAGIQNRSGLAQNGCRGMRFLDSFGNTWRGGLEVHYFPQIPSFFWDLRLSQHQNSKLAAPSPGIPPTELLLGEGGQRFPARDPGGSRSHCSTLGAHHRSRNVEVAERESFPNPSSGFAASGWPQSSCPPPSFPPGEEKQDNPMDPASG